jgi:hypothetical protein
VEIKGKFYADKDPNLSFKIKSVPKIKIIYSKEIKKLDLEKLFE